MGFFKDLTWDSRHMDLRYVEDSLYGNPRITSVYSDDDTVDLNYATREFGNDVQAAQRTINSNRLIMLILYTGLVVIPAIVMTILKDNILIIGAVILYTIIVIFLVEMFNQVEINRMLKKIDRNLKDKHA